MLRMQLVPPEALHGVGSGPPAQGPEKPSWASPFGTTIPMLLSLGNHFLVFMGGQKNNIVPLPPLL